jgi:uncharacterized delta-60 repeat protein
MCLIPVRAYVALVVLLSCLLVPSGAFAAWGPDTTFGTGAVARVDFGQGAKDAESAAVQPDGKVVVVGINALASYDNELVLARYNADGSLDTSFAADGVARLHRDNFLATYVALAPDGKLVVGGEAGYDEGVHVFVARFNASGSLDTSFADDGLQDDVFYHHVDGYHSASGGNVAVQSDGSVVVAADIQGPDRGAVARLTPAGALDASFADGGVRLLELGTQSPGVSDVAVDADDKVLVAGGYGDTESSIAVARLTPQGDYDTAFSGDGWVTTGSPDGNVSANAIAVGSDGDIVIAGRGPASGGAAQYVVARYEPDGTLDTAFGDGGLAVGGQLPEPVDVGVGPDGKVVAVGAFDGPDDFQVMRLTASGVPDTSFSGDGFETTDFAGGADASYAVAVAGPRIVVAGAVTGADGTPLVGVARYTDTGAPDASFSGDGLQMLGLPGGDDELFSLIPGQDGSLVATGAAEDAVAVASLTADGTPNGDFADDGRLIQPGVFLGEGAAAPGGQLVLAGNADGSFAVERLTSSGAPDVTFADDGRQNTSIGASSSATAVLVQPDGKIIAAGFSRSSPPGQIAAFARYNTDGSLDTSFSADGIETVSVGNYVDIAAVALEPDGKIVAVGVTNADNVDGGWVILRLDADGSLDPTFSGDGVETTASGTANAVAVQPDEKIVVGGGGGGGGDGADDSFTVVRLNADGSADTTWAGSGRADVDFGPRSPHVDAIALEPDGDVVAAGSSSQVLLARFTPSGGLDTSFSADGKLIDDSIEAARALVVQSDGKLVVGGIKDRDFALERFSATGQPVDDATPPETMISSGPSGPTTDNQPTFTFTASESGSSFECRYDSGSFEGCDSPSSPDDALALGAHIFEVRARDAAGNADPTPAERSFTVVAAMPTPTPSPSPTTSPAPTVTLVPAASPTPNPSAPPSPSPTPRASPRPSKCKPSKLKGKSLTSARKALRKAHCQLGKVKRPKHVKKGRKLVVSKQAKAGQRVNLTLKAVKR